MVGIEFKAQLKSGCRSGGCVVLWFTLLSLSWSFPFGWINSNQITPVSRVLPEKLTVPQLVKKFSEFYGTPTFATVFTRSGHLSLPSARSIQSMSPQHTSWRSVLIVSSHLRLGLTSGLLLSDYRLKYCMLLWSAHACYMPWS